MADEDDRERQREKQRENDREKSREKDREKDREKNREKNRDKHHASHRGDDRETTYSGEFGERNRNTPGRSASELGLDREQMHGQSVVGDSLGSTPQDPPDSLEHRDGERKSPGRVPGVEKSGTGGVSESGGVSGGARGNSGTSNGGAGGPTGESRGGPAEYKSTSRGDLDRSSD